MRKSTREQADSQRSQSHPNLLKWIPMTTRSRAFLHFLLVFGALLTAQAQTEKVLIDNQAEAHAFPHFWEQMFGSGRAILSLRESYRSDLRQIKNVTGMQYVRFHAIFQDEVGLYDEDAQGQSRLQFFLRRSDLRWIAGKWSSSLCRTELHAEEACIERCASRLLVQAECLATEGLRQMG